MEFKYIFFNSVDFLFAGLRTLCVKMKTFLFEESALRHENKRNCFLSCQDHYLKMFKSMMQ